MSICIDGERDARRTTGGDVVLMVICVDGKRRERDARWTTGGDVVVMSICIDGERDARWTTGGDG